MKIAEMTVWEKTFRETHDDVREDVEKKKKKMPGELFKGTIRFFDYCRHSDWEISIVIYGRQFIKLLLIDKQQFYKQR